MDTYALVLKKGIADSVLLSDEKVLLNHLPVLLFVNEAAAKATMEACNQGTDTLGGWAGGDWEILPPGHGLKTSKIVRLYKRNKPVERKPWRSLIDAWFALEEFGMGWEISDLLREPDPKTGRVQLNGIYSLDIF